MKFKSLLLPILASIIVGSLAANAAIWQWSKTAATNATADPSINWSEGMSPSSVNDSARAMMARIAEWRDDLSGLMTTAGTATAYTLTTNQAFDSTPTNGQAIAFTVHVSNGLAPTLRTDGGNTYAIHSAAGTPIGSGVLLAGAPYTVKFNSVSSAWVLHGFYAQPFVVPVGGLIDYVGTTSPNSNFVLPAGQCISRSTYSTFFALVGTRYGVCDGTTTFAVPDFRGTLAVGLDNMNGSTRGLITVAGSNCDGTVMGVQCGAQNVSLTQANLPAASLTVTDPGHNHSITDPGHSHPLTDPGHVHAVTDSGHNHTLNNPSHAHSVTDPGHSHGVSDPGHNHGVSDPGHNHAGVVNVSGSPFGAVAFMGAGNSSNSANVDTNTTGIGIANATTGLSVSSTTTGLSVNATTTSISANSATTGVTVNAAATGTTVGTNNTNITGTVSNVTSISVSTGGSGTAVNNLPPMQTVTKLLRVF